MRWAARLGDQLHHVRLTRNEGGAVEGSVDGREYSLNLTEPQPLVYSILHDGVSHEAILQPRQGGCRVRLGPRVFDVIVEDQGRAELKPAVDRGGRTAIRAVMPGRVLRVLVEPGQEVTARQGLVVVEAMKMENELDAPRDGVVREIRIRPGRTVETGDVLVVIE